ncbi:hypothetical protein B0H13DRAFT_2267853 [Mycena leptocephala]|nr:hypothetical protein B0H13DRAFT_2267853 [Mycena leptocephala]
MEKARYSKKIARWASKASRRVAEKTQAKRQHPGRPRPQAHRTKVRRQAPECTAHAHCRGQEYDQSETKVPACARDETPVKSKMHAYTAPAWRRSEQRPRAGAVSSPWQKREKSMYATQVPADAKMKNERKKETQNKYVKKTNGRKAKRRTAKTEENQSEENTHPRAVLRIHPHPRCSSAPSSRCRRAPTNGSSCSSLPLRRRLRYLKDRKRLSGYDEKLAEPAPEEAEWEVVRRKNERRQRWRRSCAMGRGAGTSSVDVVEEERWEEWEVVQEERLFAEGECGEEECARQAPRPRRADPNKLVVLASPTTFRDVSPSRDVDAGSANALMLSAAPPTVYGSARSLVLPAGCASPAASRSSGCSWNVCPLRSPYPTACSATRKSADSKGVIRADVGAPCGRHQVTETDRFVFHRRTI